MSLKEQLKQEAANEKKKFSQMSLSDKVWYIGEYYKFHILAVLIVVMLIGTVGSTVYRNIYYESTLHGFVINNRSESALDTAPYEQGFAEYMGYTNRQQLSLESSFISYGDEATEFSYASMAKVSALVASKDLDFMIVDEENFLHYVEMDAFINLEEVLPADLLPAVQERFLYAADSTGASRAYALSLEGTDFSENSHLSQDCQFFGIISNSMRTDTVFDLLRYIFG